MIKTALIIGAGELEMGSLRIPDGALVIAADGGLSHLEKAGISADYVVGDFDSLGRVPKGDNVLPSAPEKDDTDTMLAVKLALELGAETILIYGGTGGRFEHSIANLQTLGFIANRGCRGFLVGGGSICTVIKNGKMRFSPENSGYLSVFAFAGTAFGVDLAGLKYPLANHTLESDFPLGVSNEFLGESARVFVREGMLLLVWDAKNVQFL